MSEKKIILSINKRQFIYFIVFFVGVSATSNHLFSNIAIAQSISQTKNQSVSNLPNINEVKSFVYSWFALLDHQGAEISLLKFLDRDNLTMQFPEMTVNNQDDFRKWYLGVQEAIETNTHNIQQLEVMPKENGEFNIKARVNWQAQTREGEAVAQDYQQQWKVVTDEKNHLLIQDYLVEEIE